MKQCYFCGQETEIEFYGLISVYLCASCADRLLTLREQLITGWETATLDSISTETAEIADLWLRKQ